MRRLPRPSSRIVAALKVAIVALLIVLIARFARGFAWGETLDALADASWPLLAIATAANLLSLAAKAHAHHLLLRPVAPHRWQTAQTAMFAGSAVNCVGVSVGGEAVRTQVLASRDGVPVPAAVSAIVLSRGVEGLGLAVFLGGAVLGLPDEPWAHTLRNVVWPLLLALVLLARFGAWGALVRRLPGRLRMLLGPLAQPGAGRRLAMPLLLALVNWGLELLAFALCIRAVGIDAPPLAALTALVAANVGGALRLTPGNVGVLQGSVVLGLAPFHTEPEAALAAGVVLQAVQTLPVIATGLLLAGGSTLGAMLRAEPGE